jgi:hypothetical protein
MMNAEGILSACVVVTRENNMSENIDRLFSNLNSASADLKKSLGGKSGEGTEKKYGDAYQQLVKAGAKPQLKKKYR